MTIKQFLEHASIIVQIMGVVTPVIVIIIFGIGGMGINMDIVYMAIKWGWALLVMGIALDNIKAALN